MVAGPEVESMLFGTANLNHTASFHPTRGATSVRHSHSYIDLNEEENKNVSRNKWKRNKRFMSQLKQKNETRGIEEWSELRRKFVRGSHRP